MVSFQDAPDEKIEHDEKMELRTILKQRAKFTKN